MKSFKGLREEWLQNISNPYSRKGKGIDIFKNPNRKELNETTKNSRGNFRAFLMDNGDMYAWDALGIVHEEMFDTLKKVNRKYIPITGSVEGSTVMISISSSILYTPNWKFKQEDLADKIMDHRQLKRLFSKIKVQARFLL